MAVRNTFGYTSNQVEEFGDVRFTPIVLSHGPRRHSQLQAAFLRGLNEACALLESIINEIDEYWEGDDQPESTPNMKATREVTANEVFVVHGRDDGAKETVARFLSQLGLNLIVLHEQPNQGRTIMEKFEDYAQVGFAVALLTPDDECKSRDEDAKKRFRARQNVVFELGRSRTCALFKGDLDTPSDYDGVLYIKMDEDGGWKRQLARGLMSAGLYVDASLILGS